MSPRTPVRITLFASGGGSVLVGHGDDAAEISGAVQSLRISADPHSTPRVVVELAALITTVDGEATIVLPQSTKDALIALGWTPPPADAAPHPIRAFADEQPSADAIRRLAHSKIDQHVWAPDCRPSTHSIAARVGVDYALDARAELTHPAIPPAPGA